MAPCFPVRRNPKRELEVKSKTRTQSQHRDRKAANRILHLTEEFIRKITWLILKGLQILELHFDSQGDGVHKACRKQLADPRPFRTQRLRSAIF